MWNISQEKIETNSKQCGGVLQKIFAGIAARTQTPRRRLYTNIDNNVIGINVKYRVLLRFQLHFGVYCVVVHWHTAAPLSDFYLFLGSVLSIYLCSKLILDTNFQSCSFCYIDLVPRIDWKSITMNYYDRNESILSVLFVETSESDWIFEY